MNIINIIINVYRKVKIISKRIYVFINSRYMQIQFNNKPSKIRVEKLGKLVGPEFISIGEGTDIQYGTYLTAWKFNNNSNQNPIIKIGADCHIGAYNHITGTHLIEIGDGFVSGMMVTITDNSHGDTSLETLELPVGKRPIVSKGSVIIEKNVWIGDKATILPGVTIGEGSIVGANSVVTKSIPAYSVVGGNPAIIIKSQKNISKV